MVDRSADVIILKIHKPYFALFSFCDKICVLMTSNNDFSHLPLLRLLKSGEPVKTALPISALPRLADCLEDSSGDLRVAVFVREAAESDKLLLDLEIEGELGIDCQRCLDIYRAPFSIKRTLLVERANDELPMDSDEEFERVSADFTWCLDLKAVITDEILLGMPRAHPEGCLDTLMAKYMVDASESATQDSIGR